MVLVVRIGAADPDEGNRRGPETTSEVGVLASVPLVAVVEAGAGFPASRLHREREGPEEVVLGRRRRYQLTGGRLTLGVATACSPEVAGAELWVVGKRLASDHGADMETVFAMAGLGLRVRRLGYRRDVPALLAAADIFTLPSHFEGLPMSVIEAMLTGLPVVATDIRGPREQVVDGVTGLLGPPGTVAPLAAALARLVADPGLRARMGEAGRLRALDLYTERAVVERTLDLLGL